MHPLIPRVCKRWFPNGGSSLVQSKFLHPTRPSILPLFNLILPLSNLFFNNSCLPHLKPLLGRHSRTTVYRPLGASEELKMAVVKERSQMQPLEILGSVFGRTDFSRIFIKFGCRIVSRICRWISSPHFCWKKWPEKSSRKIPGKSSKMYTTKIPDTFLQRDRAG